MISKRQSKVTNRKNKKQIDKQRKELYKKRNRQTDRHKQNTVSFEQKQKDRKTNIIHRDGIKHLERNIKIHSYSGERKTERER